MKRMIIASTSTVYGSGYLDYLLPELPILFNEVKEVLFIPYAQPGGMSYDDYTAIAIAAFNKINLST